MSLMCLCYMLDFSSFLFDVNLRLQTFPSCVCKYHTFVWPHCLDSIFHRKKNYKKNFKICLKYVYYHHNITLITFPVFVLHQRLRTTNRNNPLYSCLNVSVVTRGSRFPPTHSSPSTGNIYDDKQNGCSFLLILLPLLHHTIDILVSPPSSLPSPTWSQKIIRSFHFSWSDILCRVHLSTIRFFVGASLHISNWEN